MAKEVIVILDWSGSMFEKDKARLLSQNGAAIQFLQTKLPPECKFNVVRFADQMEWMYSCLQPQDATPDNIEETCKWIRSKESDQGLGGCTELAKCLESVMGLKLYGDNLSRVVLLLSDAEVDSTRDECMRIVSRLSRPNNALFAIGIACASGFDDICNCGPGIARHLPIVSKNKVDEALDIVLRTAAQCCVQAPELHLPEECCEIKQQEEKKEEKKDSKVADKSTDEDDWVDLKETPTIGRRDALKLEDLGVTKSTDSTPVIKGLKAAPNPLRTDAPDKIYFAGQPMTGFYLLPNHKTWPWKAGKMKFAVVMKTDLDEKADGGVTVFQTRVTTFELAKDTVNVLEDGSDLARLAAKARLVYLEKLTGQNTAAERKKLAEFIGMDKHHYSIVGVEDAVLLTSEPLRHSNVESTTLAAGLGTHRHVPLSMQQKPQQPAALPLYQSSHATENDVIFIRPQPVTYRGLSSPRRSHSPPSTQSIRRPDNNRGFGDTQRQSSGMSFGASDNDSFSFGSADNSVAQFSFDTVKSLGGQPLSLRYKLADIKTDNVQLAKGALPTQQLNSTTRQACILTFKTKAAEFLTMMQFGQSSAVFSASTESHKVVFVDADKDWGIVKTTWSIHSTSESQVYEIAIQSTAEQKLVALKYIARDLERVAGWIVDNDAVKRVAADRKTADEKEQKWATWTVDSVFKILGATDIPTATDLMGVCRDLSSSATAFKDMTAEQVAGKRDWLAGFKAQLANLMSKEPDQDQHAGYWAALHLLKTWLQATTDLKFHQMAWHVLAEVIVSHVSGLGSIPVVAAALECFLSTDKPNVFSITGLRALALKHRHCGYPPLRQAASDLIDKYFE
jgi:hypothetical protein